MLWVATDNVLTGFVACPLINVAVPRLAAPSKNSTVPLGVPAPGDKALIVAVNVTLCPNADGVSEVITLVVVLALFTTCATADEVVLIMKFTSPTGLTGVSVTYSQGATPVAIPTNAGSYTVAATLTNTNYKLVAANDPTTGTLSITQAPATINVTDLTKTYNGSPQGATVTTTPTGIAVTVTYDGLSTVPTNYKAAGYAVVAALNNGNYAASNGTGTLMINQKALSVVTNPKTRAYDLANPILDGTVSGDVAADGITASYSTTATQASNVGDYPITATLNDPNSKLANYSVTNNGAMLSITPAAATITVTGLTNGWYGKRRCSGRWYHCLLQHNSYTGK